MVFPGDKIHAASPFNSLFIVCSVCVPLSIIRIIRLPTTTTTTKREKIYLFARRKFNDTNQDRKSKRIQYNYDDKLRMLCMICVRFRFIFFFSLPLLPNGISPNIYNIYSTNGNVKPVLRHFMIRS